MTDRKAAPDRAAVPQTSIDIIVAQNYGMLDHVQALRTLGLRIFPVAERSKLPAIAGGHGHLDATTDEVTIRNWWMGHPCANIGHRPDDDEFYLDVDGGDESLRKLTAIGQLPITPTTKTPRGYHLRFRSTGIHIPQRKLQRFQAETKTSSGYVLLPPSVHPSGARYEWLFDPWTTPVAECPKWLLRLILEADGSYGHNASVSNPDHLDELRRIAKAGLRDGEGRNNAAYRLYGLLISPPREGLDVYAARDLIRHWNAANIPPLFERELSRVFRSRELRELHRRGCGRHE
ncbi:bifunctional DNA primase/polymerase [Ferroacidibacillus organovorans]|uniref:DNA primase/polymerase bifunctional N-terminal domain-containing protein n=1 Tax=Ferroacidibacillus organovorans TaxID=1765683 RepID=A0A101XPG9_9BACL|nr:bifunctional DNA primase/polymerase [Ferroacidibacillus organovorans]KUO95207.1 hypothetical protein ATW55_15365 [Ferroacidibacillus organovorans]KUO96252.1 hypothetical protein ATW55_03255 [Ferroacidibacillus organovorans]